MKTRIASEFSFEVWINDSDDYNNDDPGNFDDNWLVSAGDLFGKMDLLEEGEEYGDEAA